MSAVCEDRALESLPECEHRRKLACMNTSYSADLWVGELERSGHSDRTLDTYRRLLYKLADSLPAHTDVRDVSLTHIRAFLDSQAKRRDGARKSPATVAQNVSVINGFFDWLTKESVIPRNPTRRNGDQILSRPRQVRPEDNDNVTTITGDDVRRLLAVANEAGWSARLAVNVAVYTGARRRALTTLRLSDYDEPGRRLTFREKGGKTIAKPIPTELAQVLEAAKASGLYEGDDPYLIPSPASQRRDGVRDDRVIWRLIKDVAVKAGVSTHVHALRAAFAVMFLETYPGDVVALKNLMGHQRIETTLVYLRRYDRGQAMETVRDLSWSAAAEVVEEGVPA